MLETLRKGAGTWIAKIFIGMLVMSFAIWGIADIFGGFGGRDVATVGKSKITIQQFTRAFENQIASLSGRFGRRLTKLQAQQLGLDQQVLASLLGTATLNQQADELNLGITDNAIVKSIQADPSFRGLDGTFSQSRFNELIRLNGLSEQGYIHRQRSAQVRNQIVNALFSSIKLPNIYLDAVDRYSQEKRVIKYFIVPASKAGKIATPDDEALKKFFENRKRLFTAPEYRSIGLLTVQPEKIKTTIKVTEEELKASYDAAPERFNTPEKRLLQQIAFADEKKAVKAYAELQAGKSFEDVAKKNGFSKTEIDLGLVTAKMLADKKIRKAAFALKKGRYSKPVTGDLATVILKVRKIQAGTKSSYIDAKAKIKDEISAERAQNKVQDMLDQIEDDRAGGATLAEISQRLGLEYRKIENINAKGLDLDAKKITDVIALNKVLQSAFESDVGIETDAIEIAGDGYQWVTVLRVTPRKLKDFDKIKADVKKEYIKANQTTRLRKFAQELTQRLKDGEALKRVSRSVGANVKTSKPLKRGEKEKGLGQAVLNQAFTLAKDGFGNGNGEKELTRVIFNVTDVIAPEKQKAEDVEKMTAEISQSLLRDLLAQFVGGLQEDYKVNINQKIFNRLTGRDQS